eukprot:2897331-Alexandrium_andersonii.AAC.1
MPRTLRCATVGPGGGSAAPRRRTPIPWRTRRRRRGASPVPRSSSPRRAPRLMAAPRRRNRSLASRPRGPPTRRPCATPAGSSTR